MLRCSNRRPSLLQTLSRWSPTHTLFLARISRSSSIMAPPKPALDFIDFINDSPTPYHTVRSASTRLEKAGFELIRERDPWASVIKPGGKYYLTRNGSTIVAFAVGKKWRPGNPMAMIGAHTDSPCLRVKPVSDRSSVGYLQVGVETYGGGIWHSWFDRDLSLAGRVLIKDGSNFTQKLVKVEKPLLRIPTLAIHLDRDTNFKPNNETELYPIAGLAATALNKDSSRSDKETEEEKKSADGGETFKPLKEMPNRHHSRVLEVVAAEAGVAVADIVDFELVLYDTQKSCIGGINDDLIFSARLDNLGMTFASVMGLIASVAKPTALDNDSTIRLISCFDHEEVGSTSAQGAHSNLLPSITRRLSVIPGNRDASSDKSYESVHHEGEEATVHEQSLARSFLVSADMAHAVHPNYAGKYESSHQPAINGGTVVKINANQRYMTNSPGIVLLQECARAASVPLQLFVVRNDSPCGSTIGPGLAARLGVRTLDLGNPQLSMHSIRETGGTEDVGNSIKLFEEFFESYGEMETRILID